MQLTVYRICLNVFDFDSKIEQSPRGEYGRCYVLLSGGKWPFAYAILRLDEGRNDYAIWFNEAGFYFGFSVGVVRYSEIAENRVNRDS